MDINELILALARIRGHLSAYGPRLESKVLREAVEQDLENLQSVIERLCKEGVKE